MDIKRIPFNPLYPLPADYKELTSDGQRLARVNACRQWILSHPTKEEAGRVLVACTRFFDLMYLHPDGDFNPLFYDTDPAVTPDFHWDISRQWGMHRLNIAIAPRGAAKSTHCRRDMVMRLVSHPGYSFVYATSTHDNARHTGFIVREQCYNNSRIIADFGRMKPSRGDKPSGVEYYFLNNGSYCRCVSVESRIRGLRPRRFRLDDPEYDAKASTSMSQVRENMAHLLQFVVLPMVMRPDCGVDWLATFVSRRHFAWHAMATHVDPATGKVVATDPVFAHWSRLLIKACYEDEDGNLQSVWPDMWPVRIEDEKDGRVSLERIRHLIGNNAFNAEYMGNPSAADDGFFTLDTDPHGKNAYWFSSPDGEPPLQSQALIHWRRGDEVLSMPLCEFLRRNHVIITVDTAYTEKSTSDRKCALVAAFDRTGNEIFVLDLWSGRQKEAFLVRKCFELAEKWGSRMICPEVVRDSHRLYHTLQHVARTRLQDQWNITTAPKIHPIRPGSATKSSKIESLDLRFEHGLIKLPFYKAGTSEAWWRRLFNEIHEFSPEVANGGLEHDDELDCLAMVSYVVKGRLRQSAPEKEKPSDVFEEIRRGKRYVDGTDVPLLTGIDVRSIPRDILHAATNPTRDDGVRL